VDGSRDERRELGRSLREVVPRDALGEWSPGPTRRDPIQTLATHAKTRIPELAPYRYERMAASPFGFLRGSAEVMAGDLATTPVTGLSVQACGDAHLCNFGEFATPERNIVFDINDFDETLPGPWEWDVKRLAASLEVVLRTNAVPKSRRRLIVTDAAAEYRRRMAEYGSLRALEVWYSRIDIGEVVEFFPLPYRGLVRHDVAKARRRTHLRALSRLTEEHDGRRRFIENPPLLVRLERTEFDMDDVLGMIDGYRASLTEDRRELFDRFRLVDVARKVVGVGSVGTRCWVGLLEGPHHPNGDPLFLQVKEANASVLEPFVGGSALGHHGLRVVSGQRLIQAASDIFLGWSEGPHSGRHYYVRQLWDVKGAGDPAGMAPTNLAHYGKLCAWALARAHARTGDSVAISGYLGKSDQFDRAIADFADSYGRQTWVDHASFAAAGSAALTST
jgi:uncharacterized protein (DUF2252 family)